MAQDGDTITYTFSGSKETEDISNIDEIVIDQMHGADGGFDDDANIDGGSGGLIENANIDVSSNNTLEIWVGEKGLLFDFGVEPSWGRSNGGKGDARISAGSNSGNGGGSTEIWVDSESEFVAAVDAGGGAGGLFQPGGGGGARGGLGADGELTVSGSFESGTDAEGSGFGGDGGRPGQNGSDGGQELGAASGGTTTKGGSSDGNGEITLSFLSLAPPVEVNGTEITAIEVNGQEISLSEVKNIEINGQDI